eukprot:349262-Pelagomonas_calceolata.AAC.5
MAGKRGQQFTEEQGQRTQQQDPFSSLQQLKIWVLKVNKACASLLASRMAPFCLGRGAVRGT